MAVSRDHDKDTYRPQLVAALVGIAGLSALISVLYLTGSLYMLEVYDRVLPSRSIPTLVGLSAIVAGLYAFQGFFDLIPAGHFKFLRVWSVKFLHPRGRT